MGKHRKNENYLTNKELEIKTLKGIKDHQKQELSQMAVLAVNLSKYQEIPLEWRKKDSEGLTRYILENKKLKLEVIYKKLK